MDGDATSSLGNRLKHAWNVFLGRQPGGYSYDLGPAYSRRPDSFRARYSNERSIVSSVLTRISIDCAENEFRHVRLDDNKRYASDMDTGLNDCLTVEANLDQGARAFRQDMVLTLLEEGSMAIVPVDTTLNPKDSNSWDIKTMRVGKIVQWYPEHVRVSVYNQDPKVGRREEIDLPKRTLGIVENPLYTIMNEPNSTLQRLIHKLNLLDAIDEQSSSGKLDIIIQLPYTIRSEARKKQANERRKSIEDQLAGSQYGIAYADATEKITQLNRPAENNLLAQVQYLTTMLYGQLGITEEVINGTADEATMLNYRLRTIKPIMDAIKEAMVRSFLTKTARAQKQSIIYVRNPFASMTLKDFAEVADKLTRNEVATSNELRDGIGMKPSSDPKADKLGNPNMPEPKDSANKSSVGPTETGDKTPNQQEQLQEGNLQNGV